MECEVPEWRTFEIAVAKFVAAIAPDAKVTHDVKIPDADTGFPRQRDVWIQGAIGGHFPIKAMISCKFWSKVLDEKDIDHFNGEFISSKAHVGIVYSRAGFNSRAIEKAAALGFHCCKLYTHEPPELPNQLVFGLAYHFVPRIKCWLDHDMPASTFQHWKDVFELKVEGTSIGDTVVNQFDQFQAIDDPTRNWEHATVGHEFAIDFSECVGTPNKLNTVLSYHVRRAKAECTLLQGSYNFTSSLFAGDQNTPWIDIQSADPGPGWEEVQELPRQMPVPLMGFFMRGPSISTIAQFGNLKLTDDA